MFFANTLKMDQSDQIDHKIDPIQYKKSIMNELDENYLNRQKYVSYLHLSFKSSIKK